MKVCSQRLSEARLQAELQQPKRELRKDQAVAYLSSSNGSLRVGAGKNYFVCELNNRKRADLSVHLLDPIVMGSE